MSFNKEYEEETKEIRKNISNIKHKIIVMSGKGGVGKSTISSNLAGFLAMEGFQTGILDIDLHGPSTPKLLGLSGRQLETDNDQLLPVKCTSTLRAISIGFMLKSDGGRKLAEEEKITFLGKISLDSTTANNCDDGKLTINSDESVNKLEMMEAFKHILNRSLK